MDRLTLFTGTSCPTLATYYRAQGAVLYTAIGVVLNIKHDSASKPTHNTQSSSLEEVFTYSPPGLSKSQENLCVAVRDPLFVGRAHRKLIEEFARLRHRTIGIVG